MSERTHKQFAPSEFMAEVAISTNFKPFPPEALVFASSEYIEPDCVKHMRNEILNMPVVVMPFARHHFSETRQPMWIMPRPVIYEPETLLDKLWSWIWRKLA